MSSISRGPSNIDDLLSSTLDDYRPKLTEQFYKGNVVTRKLFEAGSIQEIDGGNEIVRNIAYQDGGTVAKITRSSSINISQAQEFTQARYPWSAIGGSVVIGDWERAQNSGNGKLFDLLAERVANVREEMDQQFEAFALASSTADTTSLWSLLDIIDASDPVVANYGDIARASYSWWAATETASGSMASQGLEDIRTAYHTTSRAGMDPVGLLVSDQASYLSYQGRLTPFEQLAPTDKGDLEFESLAFLRKPYSYSEVMPAGTLLGLNLKHTKLVVNKNMKFSKTPFVRTQDGQSEASLIRL
ncbi:MAG: phage major capsid protein, partial [Chromatiaceae bacterium]|nr:phage major capsid protein [Candidatus Thioaporhodococcus sediminis]